jgi:hypothetical protein
VRRPSPLPGALAALALVAAACTSGGGGRGAPSAGEPVRVAFVDYRTGERMELVNESHTGRLEQYSEVRSDASRKVQTDDVMQGLVEHLVDQGWARFAQPGPAPAGVGAGDTIVTAMELERDGELEHIAGRKGMPPDDKQRMLQLVAAFVDTYNATYSLQAVESKPGELPFEEPVKPRRSRLGGSGGGR